MKRAWLALALCACGHKGGVAHDAAAGSGDGGAPRAIDAAAAPGDAGVGGRVDVRVEWKDAPAAMRASPGLDECGDERPGYARVHTLEGVADVVVWLDDVAGAVGAPAIITVRRCHLEPAVQLGGAELRVTSAIGDRVDVEVKGADVAGEAEPATAIASFTLPVIGHTAAVAATPWVMAVTTSASADPAYVVVPPVAFAALTDKTGVATLTGVPVGDHPVTAWLHGGAGQPARLAHGTVTVTPGAKAGITLSLATGGVVDTPAAATALDAGTDEPETP